MGPQFNLFLNGAVLVCAVMSIFNLAKIRSQGNAAILRACAFITFGTGVELLKLQKPAWMLYICWALTAILMGLEAIVKAAHSKGKES